MFEFNKYVKYVMAVIAAALAVMAGGFSSAFGSGTPLAALVSGPTDVVQTVTNPDGTVGTIETKSGTPVRVSSINAPAAMLQSITTTTTCGTWFTTGSQTYSAKLWFLPVGRTTQKFGWYFNCNKAWIASRFSWDKAGYHRCGDGWQISVTVDVQECSKTNDPAVYPMAVKVYDRFKVSALFDSFPVSVTKSMQACLGVRGGVWNCP